MFISRVLTDKGDAEFIEVASGGQSLDPKLLDKTDGRLRYAVSTHPAYFNTRSYVTVKRFKEFSLNVFNFRLFVIRVNLLHP